MTANIDTHQGPEKPRDATLSWDLAARTYYHQYHNFIPQSTLFLGLWLLIVHVKCTAPHSVTALPLIAATQAQYADCSLCR